STATTSTRVGGADLLVPLARVSVDRACGFPSTPASSAAGTAGINEGDRLERKRNTDSLYCPGFAAVIRADDGCEGAHRDARIAVQKGHAIEGAGRPAGLTSPRGASVCRTHNGSVESHGCPGVGVHDGYCAKGGEPRSRRLSPSLTAIGR